MTRIEVCKGGDNNEVRNRNRVNNKIIRNIGKLATFIASLLHGKRSGMSAVEAGIGSSITRTSSTKPASGRWARTDESRGME